MNLSKKQKNKSSFIKYFKNPFVFDSILSVLVLLAMLLIISNPTTFTSGTVEGLKLFFFNVLPGLFPFMLLTKILTEIGLVFKLSSKLDKVTYKLFGTPGVSAYALCMSVLSGYPIGAKIIGELYEKNLITTSDAKKMSVFCTTSGPIFVIGAVGVLMFKSFTFGVIMYLSHIISSIMLGIIVNIFTKKDNDKAKNSFHKLEVKKSKNILADSISASINSLFLVGAYITIFYLTAEMFGTLGIFNFLTNLILPILQKAGLSGKNLQGVIYGILEVTRGAKELSLNISPSSVMFASAIISFSGLSIIMQEAAFLKPAGVKITRFVIIKIIHAILSALLAFGLLFLIK